MTARPSEDELIARYFAPLAGPAGLGLATTPRCWRRRRARISSSPPTRWSPACISSPTIRRGAIARKALRVNLSDLAAKGAEPLGFLARSRACPPTGRAAWLAAFAAGLGEDAAALPLPADRRRHGEDAGAADARDHRARRGRGGPHGRARRRQAGRPALCHAARSATRRWACGCGWGRGRSSPKPHGAFCSTAISCRSRASRWRRRWRATPAAAWTSPTASSAI